MIIDCPEDLTRFQLTQPIEKQRNIGKRVRKNVPKYDFQKIHFRTRWKPWKIKKNGRFLYLPLELVIPTDGRKPECRWAFWLRRHNETFCCEQVITPQSNKISRNWTNPGFDPAGISTDKNKTLLIISRVLFLNWWSQRDSNPCCSLERAAS